MKQITEQQIEQIIQKLNDRIDYANTYFLESIGSSIKKIKKLTPSQAQKLIQILKYDGSYEQIVNEIAKQTGLNVKDINEIFKQYAKKDQMFYRDFYKYRNKPFIPFEENVLLKRQTDALRKIAQNEMFNFTRNNVLGYSIKDLKGRVQFMGLRETYNRVLDEALLNVGRGEETFDQAMSSILEQLGRSGLKTIDYESGRSVRLDSAIQMHLKGRLRELHNENQKIIGEEIGADGVEISVHINPAPDHAPVQGRQFSDVKPNKKGLSEWEKLQAGKKAKAYNGKTYTLDHDHKNGYRPISEMNCYHYIFSIVLGVSKPEYDDEQLQKIIDDNEAGFDFEGKHYTNYQGTQMQRRLERAIREQKDIQILAKSSDNTDLIQKSQSKIRILTEKYNKLNAASGLKPMKERLKVSGYRRTKIK